MFGYEHFGMGLAGLGMILFWILPLVLLIALFYRLFSDRGEAWGPSALEILDARYARGELDRETYLQQRADLEGQGPPPSP